MKKKAFAIAATAVVLLSGCSTEKSPAPEETAEKTGKSVSQWASKISQITYDVDSTYTDYRDSSCSASSVDYGDTTCQLKLQLMTIQAQTLGIETEMITDPTHENYMGEPPEEISDLASETIATILEVSRTAELVDCPGDDCLSGAFEFESNMSDLKQELTGWSPYN